jgi:heme exporter protein D
MNWKSVGEFLAMGGYGFYVWGSYLVTALVLAVEVIALVVRRRTIVKRVSRSAGLFDDRTHETQT